MLSATATRVLARLGAAHSDPGEDGARFEPAGQDALEAFGGLVFAPREPTRRVTSLGVLWHGRRVGHFDGRQALHFEHVVLEPALGELEGCLHGLGTIDGLERWALLDLAPQTRDAQGHFVLEIPEAPTCDYDTAALLLYGALRRDPAAARAGA